MPTTSLLVILDGFGHSTNTENNAIAMANMPTWDDLWGNHPHTLISGSGIDVGLPDGQMGNSEVGHMNLGSGRVVYQDFTRINKSIEDGDFADNTAIVSVTDSVTKSGGALHVMGLLSPGGVHSHEEQIFSLIKVAAAKGIKRIYLHAFLDGRDTPPRSAKNSLDKADALLNSSETISQNHQPHPNKTTTCPNNFSLFAHQGRHITWGGRGEALSRMAVIRAFKIGYLSVVISHASGRRCPWPRGNVCRNMSGLRT